MSCLACPYLLSRKVTTKLSRYEKKKQRLRGGKKKERKNKEEVNEPRPPPSPPSSPSPPPPPPLPGSLVHTFHFGSLLLLFFFFYSDASFQPENCNFHVCNRISFRSSFPTTVVFPVYFEGCIQMHFRGRKRRILQTGVVKPL
ncbi:hypothetical protein P5V15_012103 [Pogonomyrmex californicus]